MCVNSRDEVIRNRSLLSFAFIFLIAVVPLLSFLGMGTPLRVLGPTIVWTDKPDYSPGEVVMIYGSGFLPVARVTLTVVRPDGSVNPPPWVVDTDYLGNFTTTYQLDGILGIYRVTGTDGTNAAETAFSDGDIDWNQCVNDSDGNDVKDDCEWVTGGINRVNSVYKEGDAVPQRLFHQIDAAGTHTMDFRYDFSQSSTYSYDFLTTVDLTQSGALLNQCGQLPGWVSAGTCSTLYGGALSAAIPSDPFDAVSSRENPLTRVVKIGGVTSASVSIVGHDPSTPCFQSCGNSVVNIQLTFTTASANQIVGVWFAGHLSQSIGTYGWGVGWGSAWVSGSPFHLKYIALDGKSVGNRDNQIQNGGVFTSPAIATTIKDAGNNVVTSVVVGTTVHDTATLSGATSDAGGTVTYHRYTTIGCTGASADQTVAVTSGVVPDSSSYTVTSAGSMSYKADYSGDVKNAPATSECEPLTVNKASPSIVTLVSPSTVGIGGSVTDTATLSSGYNPTGTITFRVFAPGDTTCSGIAVFTSTVTVAGNGPYVSSSFSPTSSGTYQWTATYSGDSSNNAVGSACGSEPLTVTKASPTIATLIKDSNGNIVTSITVGTVVHDTATLTGGYNPMGTVTYNFYANGACSGTPASTETMTIVAPGIVPDGSSFVITPAGSYSFNAHYSGDGNNNAADSACEPLTVDKATPSVVTEVHNSTHNAVTSVTLGSSVHDRATVSGGYTPTGNVTYNYYTNGVCSGTPSSTETVPLASESSTVGPLAAGSYSFRVRYNGDSNNNAVDSACEPFTVSKAATTVLTQVHNPSHGDVTGSSVALGTAVHDSASVTGQIGSFPITGTVTYHFYMNGVCSGSPADQTVSVGSESSAQTLGAGSYGYTATYNGDSNYLTSTSVCEPFAVNKAATSVSTQVHNPSHQDITGTSVPLATSIHDNATVSGTVSPFPITGTVTYDFYTNNACSGSPSVSITVGVGSESGSTGPLIAGSYGFQATYNGDSSYSGSSSPCEPLTVSKASTSTTTSVHNSTHIDVTGTSVPLGTAVHDSASVSGEVSPFLISGSVTYSFFKNGGCTGTPFSTQTVSAGLESAVQTLGAGTYSYNATYGGDGNYFGSSSSCEPFSVSKASPTIVTEVHNPSHVDVTGGSVPLATVAHDNGTLSGVVAGFPATGTVTYRFFANGVCSGIPTSLWTVGLGLESGFTGSLVAGSYSFNATYSGNGNYTSSTSVCEPFTVEKAATTTVTEVHDASHNPVVSAPLASSIHDNATAGPAVSPFPVTGTVTYSFFENGGCTGSPFSTESVSVGVESTVQTLGAGSYSYNATYSGDSNYQGSTSLCEPFTISKASTTIVTHVHDSTHTDITGSSVPLGTLVHDSASVGPQVNGFTITGTVTYRFYSSADCTGSHTDETVSVGSESTPNVLGAGSYSYIVVYSGDGNYDGSTSICEPFTVNKASTSTVTAVHVDGSHVDVTGSIQPLATSIHDNATVSGAVSPFAIGGSVTYYYFANGACSGVPSAFVTVAVGSESGSTGPLIAGSYSFNATYNGDTNYLPSTSPCEPLTVSKASTSTTTSVHNSTHIDVTGTSVPLGTAVHDSASVSGEVSPFLISGSVTYSFFKNGGCTGTPFSTQTVSAGLESAVQTLGAGTYSYNATYGGDGNYFGSSSSCEPFSVSKASPTIVTEVHNPSHVDVTGGSVSLGTVVHDSATVGPQVNGFVIGGTVTYNFYTNGACTGSPSSTETVAVGTESSSTAALAAGAYGYNVHYSGDDNYVSSTSSCEPFTVNKASTTTSTEVHDPSHGDITSSSVPLGTAVHDSASVGGQVGSFSITGTVTYHFYSGGSCSGSPADETVPVGSESAPKNLGADSYSYRVDYSGDDNYGSSTSVCEPFSIGKASTSVSTQVHDPSHVDITGTSVPLGTAVHDSASIAGEVTGFPITGTVTYHFYSNGACTGSPTDETVPVGSESSAHTPASGSYSYSASYGGDSNYEALSSVCEPFSIGKTPTSVTTEVHNPSHVDITGTSVALGTVVHDNATVGGKVDDITITGTVTFNFFKNGGCTGTPFSTETVSVGIESTAQTLGAGSYSFNATYGGDSNYLPSISACEPFSVSKADTGTVTAVHVDGSHVNVTSTALPLGTSLHDSAAVGPAVSPFPITGDVTYSFFKNGGCTGSPFSTETVGVGVESSSTGALAAGSYSFQATYSGDNNYQGSTSACEPFTISKAATTTLTQVHNSTHADITGTSVPLGTEVHDSATVGTQVNGFAISGSVTYSFFTNGACSGTATSSQTVTMSSGIVPESTTQTLGAGSYSYNATYSGDTNYDGATSVCEPFSVNKVSTSITTRVHNPSHLDVTGGSIALGTAIHDSAAVSGQVGGFTIIGSVTYRFYTTAGCTGLSADETVPVGSESTPQTLGAGSYSYSATYNGDSNYDPSTSSCEPFTVNKATTAITTEVHDPLHNDVTGGSVPSGVAVHDSATVGPEVAGFPITGAITYRFYTTASCSGSWGEEIVAVGRESTPQTLLTGSYSYGVTYGGDANYYGSVSGCESFTVTSPGSITLIKQVINNNNGSALPDDFHLTIDGVIVASGSTTTVSSGIPHTIGETLVPGYTFISITGDTRCPATLGGTVTLSSGEHITCTIRNDDQPARLIIIKHVINDNFRTKTASDFTIIVDGNNPVPATIQGQEAPGVTVMVDAGFYNITETGPTGYVATYSGDCVGTINVGEEKACTIINDDLDPTLTVIKHVINDNSGIAQASDFTLTVTGNNPQPATFPGQESPGTMVIINSGTYSVIETGPGGYATTYSPDCTGTIDYGQDRVCMITNNDIGPSTTIPAVGGVVVEVDRLALLAPLLQAVLPAVALTAILLHIRRKRK